MKALTIHQPWAWGVAAGHKPVENRTWEPPREMIGKWIAIHAGQKLDEATLDNFREVLAVSLDPTPAPEFDPEQLPRGAVIGVAQLAGVVIRSDSLWFRGPFGWEFENATLIEPVPCRGAKKLWDLPRDVYLQVRRNYAAAIRAAGERRSA